VAYAVLAGVDSWNVDDTNDPSRRVHTRLLAEDILIVEHLCSFPVRAFAELSG
jgi:arylformamidase